MVEDLARQQMEQDQARLRLVAHEQARLQGMAALLHRQRAAAASPLTMPQRSRSTPASSPRSAPAPMPAPGPAATPTPAKHPGGRPRSRGRPLRFETREASLTTIHAIVRKHLDEKGRLPTRRAIYKDGLKTSRSEFKRIRDRFSITDEDIYGLE